MILAIIAAIVLGGSYVEGSSAGNVLLVNDTGLIVARLIVGERTFESFSAKGDLLIHVQPHKYHMKIVFRGGASSDWAHFDFRGVHEVIFIRQKNKIGAHYD